MIWNTGAFSLHPLYMHFREVARGHSGITSYFLISVEYCTLRPDFAGFQHPLQFDCILRCFVVRAQRLCTSDLAALRLRDLSCLEKNLKLENKFWRELSGRLGETKFYFLDYWNCDFVLHLVSSETRLNMKSLTSSRSRLGKIIRNVVAINIATLRQLLNFIKELLF